jgi:hypothetical protein
MLCYWASVCDVFTSGEARLAFQASARGREADAAGANLGTRTWAGPHIQERKPMLMVWALV